MSDNMDNTIIAKELEDFHKKKEDVFKNMGMLNNLSEKLSMSIHEEEKRIGELQAKDIVDKKKKQSDMELELLKIENAKMESYLEILQKKQDLELQFIEKLCAQKSRVEKVTEKYPHVDFKKFQAYDDYYYDEVQATSHKNFHHVKRQNPTKQQMYADRPLPSYGQVENVALKKALPTNEYPERNTSQEIPGSRDHQSMPPAPAPTPPAPASIPAPPPPPSAVTRMFQEVPLEPNEYAALQQRPSSNNEAPPARRESLQDHLQNALSTKFSRAIQPFDDNQSDGSFEST